MNGPKFLCYERHKTGVLVVEPETQIHLLLQLALQPHGYDLKFSASFQEGLDLLERHQEEIVIVLLGGSILGPDANQTLTAVRNLNPHVVILVMTGDIVSHDPQELSALGVAHVLKKPFHVADLLDILHQAAPKADAAKNEETDKKHASSEEDERG